MLGTQQLAVAVHHHVVPEEQSCLTSSPRVIELYFTAVTNVSQRLTTTKLQTLSNRGGKHVKHFGAIIESFPELLEFLSFSVSMQAPLVPCKFPRLHESSFSYVRVPPTITPLAPCELPWLHSSSLGSIQAP